MSENRAEDRGRPVTEPAWLRDHAVNGISLVPGALFVAAGLSLEHELPRALGEVSFPAMLPCETPAGSDAEAPSHPRLYVTREGDGLALVHGATGRRHATGTLAAPAEAPFDPGMPQDAPARNAAAVYASFSRAGNEYGAAFRPMRSVCATDREVQAQVGIPAAARDEIPWVCHPVLIDACVQSLALLRDATSLPFVLESIERVVWHGGAGTGARVHALQRQQSSGELLGDVMLTDDSGELLLSLHGVRLQDVAPAADERPVFALDLAATFTAEPLVEFIDCLAAELGHRAEVSIAPYGQVFQSLLDPSAGLLAGTGQVSATLLRFEDWLREASVATAREAPAEAGDLERLTLANGLDVAHLNEYESQYLFQEIFVDRAYARGGVEIRDGDTVVDIGANIGLFSLWAAHEARDVRIVAVEPSPVVFPILEANGSQYASDFAAVRAGASDREGTADFTFYERSSVFSGFAADESEDRRALATIIRKVLQQQLELDSAQLDEAVEGLIEGRLDAKTFSCQLVTVSDLIRSHDLERIDLLKIDAEKSEVAVLDGIDPEDWERIEQLVIEVHDPLGPTVSAIRERLLGHGFEVEIHEEELLERSGLFNLYAVRPRRRAGARNGSLSQNELTSLRQTADDWVEALTAYSSQSTKPHVVLVAPPGPAMASGEIHRELEDRIAAGVAGLPNVSLISSGELRSDYPVPAWYDSVADRVGHMPYPRDAYAALGAGLLRAAWGQTHARAKVVVLDCDETLWEGVVGEDGPTGLRVGAGRRNLQQKILEARDEGVLIALCSKNAPEDVFEVLREHPDMLIREEHIAAHRIGWGTKSLSILELAQELSFGLDSFVFIDDNPVECAEVGAAIPELLILQVPRDDPGIGAFSEHLWALDRRAAITSEDRKRADRYRDERRRKELQSKTTSLGDFIDGLGLEVSFYEIGPEHLSRASQLTQRTNQFNLTTVRRSEGEVEAFLAEDGNSGIGVSVKDRFGDYGEVGLVLCQAREPGLEVDTFLLSCRVLGRGVEHRVAAYLAERAQRAELSNVVFRWLPSPRNQPAEAFLESIAEGGGVALPDGGVRYELDTSQLHALRFEPEGKGATSPASSTPASIPNQAGIAAPSAGATRIATVLADPSDLAEWARKGRVRKRALATPFVAPEGELEETIAGVWRSVLSIDRVGRDDLFFDLGGTSFAAVQAIAKLEADHQIEFSIIDWFENPSVAALAAARSVDAAPAAGPSASEEAKARGEARRGKRRRKRRGTEDAS